MSTDTAPSRGVRKGPPITIDCPCGQTRQLHYGEEWTCESCGRHWNTNKIPPAEYDMVRRTKLRFSIIPISVAVISLIVMFVLATSGHATAGLVFLALVATGWNLVVKRQYQRRYREAIAKLPDWRFEPD